MQVAVSDIQRGDAVAMMATTYGWRSFRKFRLWVPFGVEQLPVAQQKQVFVGRSAGDSRRVTKDDR
jgi:hypothetical protein